MSKSERVDEVAFLAPLVTGAARIAGGVGNAVKSLARKRAMDKAKEKLSGGNNDPKVKQALNQEMEEALHTAYFNFGLQLIDEGRRRTRAQKNRTAARRASGQEFQDSDKTLMRGVKSEPALLSKASDGIKRVAGGIKRANKLRKLQKQRGLQAAKAKREAELAAKKAPIPKPSSKRGAVAMNVAPGTADPEAAARNRGSEDPIVRRAAAASTEQEADAASAEREKARVRAEKAAAAAKEAAELQNQSQRGTKQRGTKQTVSGRIVDRFKDRVADFATTKGLRTGLSNTRQSFNRGRAAAKAGRERIQFQHTEYKRIGSVIAEKSAAWTRKEGKNPSGGLNAKGVASYRAKNPGSKLKTAVTTKPSKLKKGSKAAKRRSSFCSRMSGMRKRQNPKNNTGKDRLSLSLKKWNC